MNIAVIGGINIDLEGTPREKIKYHDSNPGTLRMSFGGVGRNIAENLARLGEAPAMLSAVGPDTMGQGAADHLRALGVDTSMVFTSKEHSSSMYVSILNRDGDMELAMSDMDIVEEITPQVIRRNLEGLLTFRAICLDANLSRETLDFASEKLAGVKLFYDPVSTAKGVRAADFIGRFYAVKPNMLEAEVLTGIKIREEGDVVRAGERLLEAGVKQVYITMNSKGVYYSDGRESGFIRPREGLEIKSATGAGDSFSACVLYGMANDLSPGETAGLGMAAAEITMEAETAVNPRMSMELLKKRIKK